MTIENEQYGKATWKKCSVCGLLAGDMIGEPPHCTDKKRCLAVSEGRPMGGAPWPTPESPELRTAFELDEAEKESVRKAVMNYQTREAEEKAEHAILATAILDEAVAARSLTPTFTCGRCGLKFIDLIALDVHVSAIHGDVP